MTILSMQIHVELLEIMELYTETLIARFALLEMNSREPDPSIKEPLCAIIHAAPRIELREMHALREMLMTKYGRDFALAAMENTDNCVGDRVMSRLKVETPSKELVDMYIAESEYAFQAYIGGRGADLSSICLVSLQGLRRAFLFALPQQRRRSR